MSRGLFCPNCLHPVDAKRPRCPRCGHVCPPAGWPADEYLGRLVNGKYTVTDKLGQGGFGVVLRARHTQEGTDLGDVVLKFLHPHLASNPQLRRRFVNEAKAARALRSPHVVKVFDFAFDERGLPFMVMEYLEGAPLSALLRRGALAPLRVVRIGIQVAGALAECHRAGVIHRDLKPSNILLLPGKQEDFAKLIDFGVARLPDASLTQSMLGTPKYMPPEQIQQQELDGGADIFALGVVLFEALAGEPPIRAAGPLEYLQRNLTERPLLLRELCPRQPEALEALLDAMMAKERTARPASIEQVEDRLRALASELERTAGPGEWIEAPAAAPASVGPFDATGTPGSLAPVVTASNPPPRRSSRARLPLLLASAVLLAGAGALFGLLHYSPLEPTSEPRSPDLRIASTRPDLALEARPPPRDASASRLDARTAPVVRAPPGEAKKTRGGAVKRAAMKRPPAKKKTPARKQAAPEEDFSRLPGGL